MSEGDASSDDEAADEGSEEGEEGLEVNRSGGNKKKDKLVFVFLS